MVEVPSVAEVPSVISSLKTMLYALRSSLSNLSRHLQYIHFSKTVFTYGWYIYTYIIIIFYYSIIILKWCNTSFHNNRNNQLTLFKIHTTKLFLQSLFDVLVNICFSPR